ncbi:MAG: carbohydrate kinase [Jannaschia helgolandensis]|jgi:fructokinase|uniref:Fructokinase n=1 Tax=Jannaschia helgolandensis TaxID=188906 RepID=A0A1H7RS54_9RHOB|nr:carbohydrate kinase [Jannaschia helgolandensis]SEL63140.1 fructokinase [Jannaschia helgolandensis]|tara:strand:+ start:644 stop:1525 length:882 start_codon:yes stop_codon:yes gene_type:complete
MILCAGEALIDMLPRETSDGPGFYPATGGAVFNTAIALGRLGAPVALHTGLSSDLFGVRLSDALSASNVQNRAAISDRPTTLAFVTLTDGHAEYAFYDEGTAGRMLSPENAPDMGGITALFIGGISLAVEPCARAYEALTLTNAHLPVMIDPNIRPGFIRDAQVFRARLDRLLAVADVVKLSDVDIDWLGMTPDEVLDAGARILCLTEGAAGVRAITREAEVRVPAHRVEVVDTVGAGDTFNAGFLAGLHRAGVLGKQAPSDGDLRAALELGVAAAAITVSRAGANPPWASEL